MTKQYFIDNFKLKYDRANNLSAPGIEINEISIFATEAMEQLIIKKYNYKSNRNQEGFEETEKRTEDLGELIKRITLIPELPNQEGNVKNGQFVKLPNTLLTNSEDFSDVYWITILAEAETDKLDCSIPNNTTIYYRPWVKEIKHDQYTLIKDDPFNKPNKERIHRLRTRGYKEELIGDGSYIITKYFLTYIQKPEPIDLSKDLNNQLCKLSDLMHREILDETIRLVLKDTENTQRLQIENTEITE